MPETLITKQMAARCQIDTAVRMLFLHREDIIAIHTIAAAARSILHDLAEGRGVGHMHVLGNVLGDHYKSAYGADPKDPVVAAEIARRARLIEKDPRIKQFKNAAANFLKHADKDPKNILSAKDIDLCWVIMDAINLWGKLNLETTTEMWAYSFWWVTAVGAGVDGFETPPVHEFTFEQQLEFGQYMLELGYREKIGLSGERLRGDEAHRPGMGKMLPLQTFRFDK